ncbi:DEAD/DEAH box helicase family protein [Vulcanimicrobium alpinum]|uniref:DEAD/DEAH box helicase family protein n=1 Tax=Vulcanimicrobium alpinum TaxID=3016050 RepID=UPI00295F1DA4|nr:DEAD/DEAH box helicase family protein [Vulcanimicrobium alpinum]
MAGPRLHGWRLPLRAWQRAAFAGWDAGRPSDALIVATPGAGKTRFATRVAHALLRDGAAGRVMVVVPREHLKAQVARAMVGAGVVLDHKFQNAQQRLARDVHGAVVTYQQVCAAPRLYRDLCRETAREHDGAGAAILLDEVHHAGDDATWGKALRDAFDPATHRVALSGTPFRSDGTAIPFVRYDRGLSVADFAYDYAAALRDGVCRALVFALHGGEAEWIARDGTAMSATFETALRERLHHSERLRTMLTQDEWIGDVLTSAHMRLLSVRAEGHRDAAGLVAAMSQDHARAIAALMERRLGVRPTIVVSDLADASERIAAFARSADPWIVAVHMVSEGVDIPRLRVGVYASNVVTELYFRQFCGRFVRTVDGVNDPEAYVFVPDDPRLRELARGDHDRRAPRAARTRRARRRNARARRGAPRRRCERRRTVRSDRRAGDRRARRRFRPAVQPRRVRGGDVRRRCAADRTSRRRALRAHQRRAQGVDAPVTARARHAGEPALQRRAPQGARDAQPARRRQRRDRDRTRTRSAPARRREVARARPLRRLALKRTTRGSPTFLPGAGRPTSKRPDVNGDDTKHSDPLDNPDLVSHLSESLRGLLRKTDDGDEAARSAALPAAAAIVDAFAAVGLLEFAYLSPTEDDDEDGPIAWLEASEAIYDKERDAVVIAGSEVLEVYDGPITLEDPPEHETDES